jgi:hypothetical protein
MLERARVAHQGTHAIRHRAATEIANSGVPIKDGMAMTGHKTVEMFLSYVHPDEQRVRKSVEKVCAERRKLIDSSQHAVADQEVINHGASGVGSGSPTARGNYRPYRKRTGFNREAPPGSRSACPSSEANQARDFSNAPKHIRHEHHFRREDLFKLVWTAPIAVIAVRIGVSDVGLAKACRKAKIPLPGRGHWTRVSAGQSLSPPELSPAGREIPDLVCITGSNDPLGRLDLD